MDGLGSNLLAELLGALIVTTFAAAWKLLRDRRSAPVTPSNGGDAAVIAQEAAKRMLGTALEREIAANEKRLRK